MPLRIMEGIHAENKRVLLLAFEGITAQELIDKADEVCFIRLTQVGRAIKTCQQKGARELILAGRVLHQKVFSFKPWHFDYTSIRLLWQLKDKRADSLLSAIAGALEKKGISVISSVHYLKQYLAKKGLLTQTAPSAQALKDIEFGLQMARGLGALDIGQTVVVKNQAVVAVEAMEGTDACIERAGQIAGPGCVVVKMAKPKQDMRFDVPVIGLTTLQKMVKAKATALAIQAEATLLIDPDLLEKADQYKIAILGM
jgi:UDP-2,3-diacylglucosamine hydrolase